jgi:hypothetical protein
VNDSYAAIAAAIAGLPSNGGILVFPEGEYRIDSPLVIDKDNVVLRGDPISSNGWAVSKLSFNFTGTSNSITVTKDSADTAINISSGYTKGSNQLILASAPIWNIGDTIEIKHLNDLDDEEYRYTPNDDGWMEDETDHLVHQITRVASISDNIVIIAEPLNFSLKSELTPQVRRRNFIKIFFVIFQLTKKNFLLMMNRWHLIQLTMEIIMKKNFIGSQIYR